MPWKPAGPCRIPGCPERAVRGGRCAQHAVKPMELQPRATAAQRGYGADWQRRRAEHLKRFPSCAICGEPGKVVDHIQPIRAGGTNDPSNLQTLCAKHHNMKTNRFDGGYGNRKVQR